MKRQAWIGALLFALSAAVEAWAGEPVCCESRPVGFLQRLGPVGGWDPYGGGLLHWWPRHCFPDCGGPDDYCRKPLPQVCWPPYPPYYIWGPPDIGSPRASPPAPKTNLVPPQGFDLRLLLW
jgi:hypothetical protein